MENRNVTKLIWRKVDIKPFNPRFSVFGEMVSGF